MDEYLLYFCWVDFRNSQRNMINIKILRKGVSQISLVLLAKNKNLKLREKIVSFDEYKIACEK